MRHLNLYVWLILHTSTNIKYIYINSLHHMYTCYMYTRNWISTEVNDFSSNLCVQTGSEAHPTSVQWVAGLLSLEAKCGRGIIPTTLPLLLPVLQKHTSCTKSIKLILQKQHLPCLYYSSLSAFTTYNQRYK
jgi:hypothetical protein